MCKRLIDLAILGLLSPIWVLLSVLVILMLYANGEQQIFYVALRLGKNKKPFKLYKFRTMISPRSGGELCAATAAQRVTPVGAFLRKNSLDEIPQILNIVRGEMSFIGPRPLPVAYRNRTTEGQDVRYVVLPGLSGLVQVLGASRLSWRLRMRLDQYYARRRSCFYDLKLIAASLKATHGREGNGMLDVTEMPNFRRQLKYNIRGDTF